MEYKNDRIRNNCSTTKFLILTYRGFRVGNSVKLCNTEGYGWSSKTCRCLQSFGLHIRKPHGPWTLGD